MENERMNPAGQEAAPVQVKDVCVPLTQTVIDSLRAGDSVLLSGTVYTARDAAHRRMMAALAQGEPLPVAWQDQVIYYVGPCPARPGEVIGSAGPTTSSRMDIYTPRMLDLGLKGMIGKGERSPEVIEAMVRHGAVYFAAIGGLGALIASRIRKAEVVAYPDLGPEAIYRLELEKFPAVVAIDSRGGNLYQEGRNRYRRLAELW